MRIRKQYQERLIQENIKRRDAAVIAAVKDDDLEPLRQLFNDNYGYCPTDEVVKRTACKVCCNLSTMPKELRDKAEKWLLENGSTPEIGLRRI